MDARLSEQLVTEMAWVRRLARALVGDEAGEDVAQDAWVVAAAQEPDAARPLRPWLGSVVRNLVRTRRRSRARGARRDAEFDATRVEPTPAELVERVELQRAVADEVLALAEPYRSTVLLHFVEGHSSAEIARRLGIPDGTVRRRLKVALDQLRAALRARTDSPKHGWLAALAPFAHAPAPTAAPATTLGVLAVKKILVAVVVLVLVLLAVGLGVWRHRAHGDASPSTASLAAAGGGAPRAGHAGAQADGAAAIPPWLVPADTPPRRIAGRVIADGAPVAGARVRLGLEVTGEATSVLALSDGAGTVLQPIAETTSAADGTFDFGPQPAVTFTVSASAPAHSAAAVVVANTARRADALVLALGACGTRMSGTITDASGGGIAKARISVAGLSGAESDATGAYRVCLAPRRALGSPSTVVRVEADSYGTIKQDVLVVGDLHLDFQLVPEAVLVGRVTTSDGRPVAGARVIARADVTEAPHHVASGWTTADGDGAFRVDGLAPGVFELTAAAAGLRTPAPVVALARPAATSRELHLVVARGARVRGIVVMNGRPVAGAHVMTIQGGRGMVGATSRSDGSFEIDGVADGAITLAAPPYRVTSDTELRIAGADIDGVQLEVAAQARVHGRVTRGGQPVEGADVMFLGPPQTRTFGGPTDARTDATGAYAIDGLPAGPGRLVAWDNVGKALAPWQSVDLAEGEDKVLDLDLSLGGEVQGTVVDETGAPVPGVYVRMDITEGSDDMCEAIADAHGRFACAMLTGGTYRPTVVPSPGGRQGFAPARPDGLALVTVPSAGVVRGVTLAVRAERLAIRGTVLDDAGTPVPDVHVEAMARGVSSMDFPSAMTDAAGRFEIADLARGTYNLHAHAADGSETQALGVAAGGEPTTITLARAGAIDGTLVGFTSTPLVLATSITPAGLHLGGVALVEGTTFSKVGLPPGRYTVQATAGAQVDGQTVELRPGETAHVTLRSRGVGKLEGVVRELGTHAPVAGMRCDARVSMNGEMSPAPPDPSQQAFTDAAGHFVVSAPIGRVRIFCFAPAPGALSPAGADVEVTALAIPKVDVFAVRIAGPPHDPGFVLAPFALPLTVQHVEPGSPAAAAGLRTGDHVVTIDGAALDGVLPQGAMVLLAGHAPTPITLGIERAGAALTVRFTAADAHP